jgi:hypothetical protein
MTNSKNKLERLGNIQLTRSAEDYSNRLIDFKAVLNKVKIYQATLTQLLDGQHSPVEEVKYMRTSIEIDRPKIERLNNSLNVHEAYSTNLTKRLGSTKKFSFLPPELDGDKNE